MSIRGYRHRLTCDGRDIEVVTGQPVEVVRSVLCVPCNAPMRRTMGGRHWKCDLCRWVWKPRLYTRREELRRTAEAI